MRSFATGMRSISRNSAYSDSMNANTRSSRRPTSWPKRVDGEWSRQVFSMPTNFGKAPTKGLKNISGVTSQMTRPAKSVSSAIDRRKGRGLVPGTEHRVFDTFAQGEGGDRHGGSGLGLAIVKGFADAMQVGVRAENHADAGAVFTLVFSQIADV